MQIGLNLALTLEHGGAGAPTLDMTFTGTGNALDSRITFTRASTGTFFNSAGVLTSAAINAPRFDYNPSTLAAQGLLIEEQRTNLLVRSEDFGNATWDKILGATVATNTDVAPDGNNTADRATIPSGGYVRQLLGSITAGASYAVSLWVKKPATGGANAIRLTTNNTAAWNTGISQKFTLTSTWQRVTATGNIISSGTGAYVIFGAVDVAGNADADCVGDVLIWGAQTEAGAFPTSYIPTTTTALTRSADVASVNTLSPWYNQTNGTVYAEFAPAFQGSATAAGNNPGVWGATQNGLGTFNGYGVRLLAQSNLSDNINGVSRYAPSGFNTQINFGPNAFLNLGQTYKTAFAWEASGIAASRDGQAVGTSTNPAAAAMGTHDQFYLGRQNVGGTPTQLNGYLRRLTYYPRRLSNAELQAITA